MLMLTKNVQFENEENRTKIKELEFKNQLLREEKKLLIEELVLKKKFIVNLSNQLN